MDIEDTLGLAAVQSDSGTVIDVSIPERLRAPNDGNFLDVLGVR
jgi:hypothetical protein